VKSQFKLVWEEEDSPETIEHKANTLKLVGLYGEEVLPPALTLVKNKGAGRDGTCDEARGCLR